MVCNVLDAVSRYFCCEIISLQVYKVHIIRQGSTRQGLAKLTSTDTTEDDNGPVEHWVPLTLPCRIDHHYQRCVVT